MSDKAIVKNRSDLGPAVTDLRDWIKKSFSENGKWLITFFSCITLGYLGIHELINKKIGRFILYLLTFGIFGFGVLADVLALLWGRTAFKNKGYPKTTYPGTVKLILFGIYLCVLELLLLFILSKLGVNLPDFTTLTWDSALQKILDFIGGAR